MKRRTFLLGSLAAAAGVAGLAGCASTSSAGGGSGGKTTIEYWHVNAETQGGTAVTELVNKFNASQTEVEVKPVFNSGMYQGLMQNLQSKAAAGAMPALVQVGWSYREYFANNYQFAEPTKIIKDHFPGDADFLSKKFLPNVLDLAKGNDGKQVGTPYSLSVPIIYANKDILDAAGVDPASLTTWEKVGAAADTIRTKVDGKKGLYIAEAADAWNIQQMLESNGGGHMLENGKAAFASPEGIATMTFYQNLIKSGSACMRSRTRASRPSWQAPWAGAHDDRAARQRHQERQLHLRRHSGTGIRGQDAQRSRGRLDAQHYLRQG